MNPHEPLFDDLIDEAFHDTLLRVKLELEGDVGRDQAVATIARWAGKRPKTIYGWLDGRPTPESYRDVVRLTIGALRDGYPHFLQWMAAGLVQLQPAGELVFNGTLNDERIRSQNAWGRINLAEEAGAADAVIAQAKELITVGESVLHHGECMKGGSMKGGSSRMHRGDGGR